MRGSIITVLALVLAVSIPSAKAEEAKRLPAGHYIYLGPDGKTSAPKTFTINSDGDVVWPGESVVTEHPPNNSTDLVFQGDAIVDANASTGSANNRINAGTDSSRTKREQTIGKVDSGGRQAAASAKQSTQDIESIEWPIIKFRPKAIPGTKDGFAQLTMTEEVSSGYSQMGTVKYKLILLRSQPIDLTLDLLDEDGFRLNEFRIHRSEFETIDGTELLAARGQFSLRLNDYVRARNFSLRTQPTPTTYSRRSMYTSE